MHSTEKELTTTDVLEQVIRNAEADYLSLNDIKNALHERGFGLLMVLFSFPTAIPLPYPPGFTIITGVPLVFFAIQMLMGKDSPWLPAFIGKKTIKRATIAAIIEKSAPYLRKIETFSSPRLHFVGTRLGERIIGAFCLLCAISVALPIPLGNAIPSAGILFMALGLLNRDGILVVLGMIVGTIGIIVSAAVIMVGISGVMLLLKTLFG